MKPFNRRPGIVSITALAASVLGSAAAAQEETEGRAPAWGTTATSILTVPAPSFAVSFDQTLYSRDSNGVFCWSPGMECSFDAGFHLPSGARIVGLQLEACDSLTNAGVVTLELRRCPINVGTCNNETTVTTGTAAPGCTSIDSAALDRTVDNSSEYYALRARVMTDASVLNAYFKAARIRYQLRVSPAPQNATFNDVGTGHPFFQFIEALAASGITSGCQVSPPLYCPDSPLTRGQMAVFIARALGLHFPN
jgi:hypothetical protein